MLTTIATMTTERSRFMRRGLDFRLLFFDDQRPLQSLRIGRGRRLEHDRLPCADDRLVHIAVDDSRAGNVLKRGADGLCFDTNALAQNRAVNAKLVQKTRLAAKQMVTPDNVTFAGAAQAFAQRQQVIQWADRQFEH